MCNHTVGFNVTPIATDSSLKRKKNRFLKFLLYSIRTRNVEMYETSARQPLLVILSLLCMSNRLESHTFHRIRSDLDIFVLTKRSDEHRLPV